MNESSMMDYRMLRGLGKTLSVTSFYLGLTKMTPSVMAAHSIDEFSHTNH